MIKMSDIMALCESGTGFVGGACVDTMPHLSLTEAVNMLPVAIAESQVELEMSNQKMNSLMVESVVSAAQFGGSVDADSLVEMSFADIKAKIKKFFDKIINFLKSIIAKIGVQIDKIRLSGKQLFNKYKDSKYIKGKDFKGLTFNGYKFNKGLTDAFKSTVEKYTGESTVDALVAEGLGGAGKFVVPSEFNKEYKIDSKDVEKMDEKTVEKAEKVISDMKDVSAEDRKANMIKALTGQNVSASSWKEDLKEFLYGSKEKEELKYGEEGFQFSEISSLLQNPVDLDKVKDAYQKVKDGCEKKEKSLNKELDDIEKGMYDKTEAQRKSIGLISNYYNAYLGVISGAYDAINAVQAAKYNACKDRNNQYKSMFGKMLTYKAKSDNNDSAMSLDSEDAFELDLID